MSDDFIRIKKAEEHNLKGWDVDVPLNRMSVITGPSGSGKTSLALHTLYAEGQRRYVETFSPYVRQFLERMGRPKVESIDPIPPALALEQTNRVRTSRSTVGTMTELTEYWKFVFSHLAEGRDPVTNEIIKPVGADEAAEWVRKTIPVGDELLALFPVNTPEGLPASEILAGMLSGGYLRYYWEGDLYRTDAPEGAPWKEENAPTTLLVVQDRLRSPIPDNNTEQERLIEALGEALRLGKNKASLAIRENKQWVIKHQFRNDWYPLLEPTPGLFSFNSALGACPKCRGFGKIIVSDMQRAVHEEKSLKDHALWLLESLKGDIWRANGKNPPQWEKDMLRCAGKRKISVSKPFRELTDAQKNWVLEGETDPDVSEKDFWPGLRAFFRWHEQHAQKMLVRMLLGYFRSYDPCPECHGARLRPEALCFRVGGSTLPDLMQMPIEDLLPWVKKHVLHPPQGGTWDGSMAYVAGELFSRLAYLEEVGLGYLTLDRATKTLSGGEVERVNLTLSLGSSLTNTLFVLDEPTVGLHPRDTGRLIRIMHRLRDRGNTLAVVEHEEAVMRGADWIIDLGPGSGDKGGEMLYAGPIAGLEKVESSLTGAFLFGNKRLELPEKRRKANKFLHVKGASHNNINNLDLDIPLGVMTCLTGVSGSGKSTLAYDILYLNARKKFGERVEEELGHLDELTGWEELSGVYLVDQSPIMRTPRSTPAVYVKAFDSIRQLFADTDEAKACGITAGYFSFNSGEGRCPRCSGCGFEKIEMQFLSDVYVPCGDCEGARYTAEALRYYLNGKNLSQVLDLSVGQACEWFNEIPGNKSNKVRQSLGILRQVGLGHLKLGQPLNTLSGGENQRLKLAGLIMESGALAKKAERASAAKSAKPSTKATRKNSPKGKLLLLDEPSTGLHFSDIEVLLGVFHSLVEAGHTLLVIEHNTEIIKCADYVLDLGPEGGFGGGKLVANGTPEEIADNRESITGRYLRPLLFTDSHEEQKARRLNEIPREFEDWTQAIGPIPEILERFSPNTKWISLRGARYHNLKNMNVDIPLGEMTVLTGLSGSGKSSLAFGIFFEEGQRRFLDVMSPYARQFTEQRERPEKDCLIGLPPTVAIEQNVSRGGSKSTVGTVTEVWDFFRLLLAKLGDIWCPHCQEKAVRLSREDIAQKAYTLAEKSKSFTLMAPLVRGRKGNYTDLAEWAEKKGYPFLFIDGKRVETAQFRALDRYKTHDIDLILGEWTPKNLPSEHDWLQIVYQALKWGKGVLRWEQTGGKRGFLSTNRSCPTCGEAFDEPEPRLFSYNSPHGWCSVCRGHGVIKPHLQLDLEKTESVLEAELKFDREVEKSSEEENGIRLCPACNGARLNELARSVRLCGMTPDQLASRPVTELHDIVSQWEFASREMLIARDALTEIERRLHFLTTVGLDYLQLNRSVRTLSGGELQRIRLSAQLGSNLQGVLYVLDEPTIGLHPRDNQRLLESMKELKGRGNSLLVVEHDTEVMEQADWIIDLGPGAGIHGGEIMAQGKLADLANNCHSVTGKALREKPVHPLRGERRPLPSPRARQGWIKITGAQLHNLKNINATFALERLNVVTGVSGAGKTSLVTGSLYPAAQESIEDKPPVEKAWKTATGFDMLTNVYRVDQTPLGRTPRSTPGTYVGFFDDIRTLFSSTQGARQRGFTASRFSFNTASGRCEACKGNGMIKWEMDFLPPSYKKCEVCQGRRYNSQTLEVEYNGKTIADVLEMSLEEAADFFDAVPKVRDPLRLLCDTGMGYLRLGQPSSTLSGGEAQRLKLVTELIKGQSGRRTATLRGRVFPKALYIIEEPSIGLHPLDVRRLIDVLHRLVDQGNTVVVIEHDLEIASEADYLIDLGPDAGASGGEIIAAGTPEQVAVSGAGFTAKWLLKSLNIPTDSGLTEST